MGAQRASWQAAFAAETAARSGQYFAQSLLDLVKAFAMIPHDLLLLRLANMAFPLGYYDCRWLPTVYHVRLGMKACILA